MPSIKNNILAVAFSEAGSGAGTQTTSQNYTEMVVGDKTYQVNKIGEGDIHLVNGLAYFAYRMLSETHVAEGSRHHCDFSEVGLDKYVSLAKGIPFHIDHRDYSSENARGKVVDAWYSSDIDGTGIGGINGIVEIDTTIQNDFSDNLSLAKKIKRGYIYSGSVQIKFAYRKSHDIEDFRFHIGKKNAEGEYYRKIVTGVEKFYEFSGLSHGADKNAGLLNTPKDSYINKLRSKFSERGFNTVLIPNTDIASFGQTVLSDNNDTSYNNLLNRLQEAEAKYAADLTELSNSKDSEKVAAITIEQQKYNSLKETNKSELNKFLGEMALAFKEPITTYNALALKLQALGKAVKTLDLSFNSLDKFKRVSTELIANDLQNQLDEALGVYSRHKDNEPDYLSKDFNAQKEELNDLFG